MDLDGIFLGVGQPNDHSQLLDRYIIYRKACVSRLDLFQIPVHYRSTAKGLYLGAIRFAVYFMMKLFEKCKIYDPMKYGAGYM